MKIKARPLLVLCHRWFGLFAAVWLLAMAITGSILVFYSELDEALNADLYFVKPQSESLPVSAWLASVEAAKPNSFVRILNFPTAPGTTAVLQLSDLPEAEAASPHPLILYVNPYTAEIVGERELGVPSLGRRHIMNVLYGLHLDLLLGEPMLIFLGLVALLWVIDHIVSLLISFTTLAKWKQSFRIRFSAGGYKRVFDLHRAGGLWLYPITLMFAISGLYFNWPAPFVHVVDAVSPLTPRYIFTFPKQQQAQFDPPVNMAAAMTVVQEASDNAKPYMIRFFPAKHAYEVRLFDARDIDSYGRRTLVIDALQGQVLSDRHITEGGASNTFIAWQYPLHSGKAFGWPGRILVFIAGIALVVIIITGVKIWLRKRRAKSKA